MVRDEEGGLLPIFTPPMKPALRSVPPFMYPFERHARCSLVFFSSVRDALALIDLMDVKLEKCLCLIFSQPQFP
jgi:hypothetical protein